MSIKQEPGTETGDLTNLELNYNIMNIKNDIEESFPQVKTECCSKEEYLALSSTKWSQEQWFESTNTVVKEEVSTSNVSSDAKGFSSNIVQVPEKGKIVRSSYSQSSNMYITETDCNTKSELLPHQREFHEHSSQMVLKSELTMSADTDADNKSFVLWDVKDFQKSLPALDDELPNWQEQVKLYKCETDCNTKSELLPHQREFHEHSSQMVLKSEQTLSADTNTDNKSFVLWDVKDFQKSLPALDDELPNRQEQLEQVKLYKCETCPYSCNFLFDLCQHNISHTKENFYVCDLCQSSYQYFLNLKCHLMSHIVTHEISFQLLVDSKSNSTKEHTKKHTQEKPLNSCDLCGYRCVSLNKLSCHLARHTRPYTCDLDYSGREPYYDSKVHKRKHSGEKPLNSCDLCGYKCASLYKLSCHVAGHIRTKSYSGRRSYDPKVHKRKCTGDKPYSCDLCDYKGKRPYDLKVHTRQHTGEEPYSCDVCDFTCKQSGTLRIHKRHHTGERPYSCDFCDFTCKQLCFLKVHTRKHTGERPYSCDLCDYSGKQSGDLRIHKRQHTGEKPYSCDLCDYTCKDLSRLKEHRRRHTNERPYSCDICDYTCTQSSNLKQHKRIHTGERPYTCDLCDYRARQPTALKVHKRKHTGERPYSCDLCDFTCAYYRSLVRHKENHTGEKRYSCDLCTYTCTFPYLLKKHKKRVHK